MKPRLTKWIFPPPLAGEGQGGGGARSANAAAIVCNTPVGFCNTSLFQNRKILQPCRWR
jgi:hypothetical protein